MKSILRSFLAFFSFGTRVAFLIASTWFHKPIKGAVQRFLVPRAAPFSLRAAAPYASTSALSSPLSNISIMMSDPPTNSPFTYS